jgi:hypothetical protein
MAKRLRLTPASAAAAIAAVVPLAFLILGVLRAYPFVDDVTLPAQMPDDWHIYKGLALNVVRQGLSLPSLASTYTNLPHGFLYIYFVALIFGLVGENSSYVYVAQSLMLGASISVTYLAVRRRLTPAGCLAFTIALTALMYVDVFRHLTFRLLSENLYFLLSAAFLLLLFRSLDQMGHAILEPFLAGLMLGLATLTRPSFLLSASLVIATVWAYWLAAGRGSRLPLLLLLGATIGFSGVVARNYSATGRLAIDIVSNMSDWMAPWSMSVSQFVDAYTPRALFAFGWTGPMAPAYRLRPHWMLLWCLWAAYPVWTLTRRQRFELWEAILYIYVAAYIVPVVFIGKDITSYGGRMIVSILPGLLIPAVRLLFPADLRMQSPSVVHDATR